MSNTPLKLTLVTSTFVALVTPTFVTLVILTLTSRREHGRRHALPRFQPEQPEEWLKVAETRVKRWRMSDELKYAMILKAFEARDLSRLLREGDLLGIGERDTVPRLLYVIGEVFVKWG